jgi:hypothetical protein
MLFDAERLILRKGAVVMAGHSLFLIARRMAMSSESGRRQTIDDLQRRIDAAGWAFFFIWVGSAILANIKWGWFLAGIGVIVLAAQAALSISAEKVDTVAICCGAVFFAGGIWEILGLKWPLAPMFIILLGVGVLWQAIFGKRKA